MITKTLQDRQSRKRQIIMPAFGCGPTGLVRALPVFDADNGDGITPGRPAWSPRS